MEKINKAEEYRIITSIEMQQEIDAQAEPEFKVYSGIPKLDKAVDGFVEGELIVISGPTKNGKTLFAQSITNNMTGRNVFPLWFSYEVTPKYFLRAFPELPLFYMPRRMQSNNLQWVLDKMLEGLVAYGTRVVFIDHLHYLVDLARMTNVSIEVGTVIRKLKSFAVQNGLIVFLLCHTKKGSAEPNVALSHESIRDSSFVAQESDTVFLIKRADADPEKGRATLLVEFHRRTGVMHVDVPLVKIGHYLVEEAMIDPRSWNEPREVEDE